jgi:hypothetical protein
MERPPAFCLGESYPIRAAEMRFCSVSSLTRLLPGQDHPNWEIVYIQIDIHEGERVYEAAAKDDLIRIASDFSELKDR